MSEPSGVRPPAAVRVMIADDDPFVRRALIDLISDEQSLCLVGAAVDSTDAIALAHAERPDVAVLDVRMPGVGGIAVAQELRRACPDTIVIGLSSHSDRRTRAAMLGAGASRFLVKGSSEDDVLATIVEAVAERATARVQS